MIEIEPRSFLLALFDTAVTVATPAHCMPRWLPAKPDGRVIVVGAGKAAASMAGVLETHWGTPLSGLVIVPPGHGYPCDSIEVVEAAHPVPDQNGVAAAARVLDLAKSAKQGDTVVCLLSGGGSSLLALPLPGISLAEKQRIVGALLRCGASIHEINSVRKKLSAIKGGKLAAAAAPATVMTLMISDVPGNDVSMVASGPTIEDHAPASAALEVLKRYDISLSAAARHAIESSMPVDLPESDVRVLATSDDALLGAAAFCAEHDIGVYSLGDLAANAVSLAGEHARLALQIADTNRPVAAPCIILSGGETTVAVSGGGRGGRNGQYGLALAIDLESHPRIYALACDTDGIDGVGDNAGCLVSPNTLQRAGEAGQQASERLLANDSYHFFAACGDLVTTGPTRTNVNDFRAILVMAAD